MNPSSFKIKTLIGSCINAISFEQLHGLEDKYPHLAEEYYANRQIIIWSDPERFQQRFQPTISSAELRSLISWFRRLPIGQPIGIPCL